MANARKQQKYDVFFCSLCRKPIKNGKKKKYASMFCFCQHKPKSKEISFTQVSSDWPATDNNQQELNKLVITG